MDLLAVFRTFRRHWRAALPVLVITALCLGYVVLIRAPDYETTGNVVLIAPPAAPKNADGTVVEQTAAGKTDNPLDRFGDPAVVVGIVSRAVSSDATREKLVAKGADSRYEIGPAVSGPVADITAVGKSAKQAELTATLVAESFVQTLTALQQGQGVDPAYFISTLPVERPEDAKPKLSSTMRLAVGVLGLGLVATFFVVSLAEARSRSKQARAAAGDGTEGGDGDGRPDLDRDAEPGPAPDADRLRDAGKGAEVVSAPAAARGSRAS